MGAGPARRFWTILFPLLAPGLAITLTLDERLQFVAEREIAAAVALHHAESGSVVVMNPYNGDVLAMASYPTFDPNLPLERGQDPKPRMNHAISVPFEPGRPSVLIAHTVKGKGLAFAENDADWHHKSTIKQDLVEQMYGALEIL